MNGESHVICVSCHKPCLRGVNVHSEAGVREVAISQMCEDCFDECTAEPDDDGSDDDAPAF